MPAEHWSLGGQQKKFALARIGGRWNEAHGAAPITHIIKPGIRHLQNQALVEHVTMSAAAALGLDIAASMFVRFEDEWAVAVERFDRYAIDGGEIGRLHQEDCIRKTSVRRLAACRLRSTNSVGARPSVTWSA